MALLPEYVVMVAPDAEGWARLRREATVIAAARASVGPAIPAIVLADPAARLQVRTRLSGITGDAIEARIFGVEPRALAMGIRYAQACPLTGWGERFAWALGTALAQLHAAVPAEQVAALGLGPAPVSFEAIARVLAKHVGDAGLLRALPRLQAWHAGRGPGTVVIHGDPHFYNMFAGTGGELVGIIDFDMIAVGDRHEDLRYVHSQGPQFAALAMAAYAETSGLAIDAGLVRRYHVLSAFEHFAWVRPDAPRFPSIVRWTQEATRALAPEWLE